VTDQAALYGLLFKLRDLALPLLSVTLLKGTAEKPMTEQGDENHAKER
jgi:hypothetical protein